MSVSSEQHRRARLAGGGGGAGADRAMGGPRAPGHAADPLHDLPAHHRPPRRRRPAGRAGAARGLRLAVPAYDECENERLNSNTVIMRFHQLFHESVDNLLEKKG